MRAPAEDQTGSLEASSRSWWQSKLFRREHPVSGRPAHGQAHACIGLVIAAATSIAVAGSGVAGFSRDGHLCRHQAPLDDRQTHPERRDERQEQSSDAMPRPAFHHATSMARLDSMSKSLQLTEPSNPVPTAGRLVARFCPSELAAARPKYGSDRTYRGFRSL